jgi:hypothetical protein
MTMNQEEYMKTGDNRARSLPAAWTDVLDSMQEVLARAAAEAERQDQALEAILIPADSAPDAVWQRGLEQLIQRLHGLQSSFEKAEAETAGLDSDLATGADAFQQWLANAQAARRKLAKEVNG